MSLVYCRECDKMIDLDVDEHFEHFSDEFWLKRGRQLGTNDNVTLKMLKGGKN